jgi:alpha-D-ribose 1-methylphosphonate 5-triphosphate synthase subunit PhnH
MTWDPVHDSQALFRKVLDALARPGRPLDASDEAARADLDAGLDSRLLALALTLCDAETSLSWPGSPEKEEALAKITDAKAAPPGEADFLVSDAGHAGLEACLEAARIGDLTDPHRGATVLALVPPLWSGGPWVASGARIPGEVSFGVEGDPAPWLALRDRKNAEFPLGVDIVLVDGAGRLLGLPRGTRVRGG